VCIYNILWTCRPIQARWHTVKSLTKRGGPKAPFALHGPSGSISYPIDKANIIADCLKKQFRAHGLCDCGHRRYVEAQVEALLATVDEDTPVNSDPVTSQKKYKP
jgi:hypothetical protein